MWYIGQKVICINDKPFLDEEDVAWYKTEAIYLNKIYTIKSIHQHLGNLVFHLFEVERDEESRKIWGELVGYGAYRFRPLLDKKADITVFTDILKFVKEPEHV